MQPLSGPIVGNTTIVLSGSNFAPPCVNCYINKDLWCIFGRTAKVPAYYDSNQQISCVSPQYHAAGMVSIAILNVDAVYLHKVTFRYEMSPVVVTISPVIGPVSGGTAVTFDGHHLGGVQASSTFCRFEDLPVAAVFISTDRIQCTSPAALEGFSSVLLTSNDQNFFDDGLSFEQVRWPSLTALIPSQGPVLGGTRVILIGDKFHERASRLNYMFCRFNATVVPVTFVSTREIMCTSPQHIQGLVRVEVTMNLQQYTSSFSHYVYAASRVLALVPSKGPANGMTNVGVIGTDFHPSQFNQMYCEFGEVTTRATMESRTMIRCISPQAEKPGDSVPVRIMVDQASYVGEAWFEFTSMPEISGIRPIAGVRDGGTLVTLYGSGFVGSGDVRCSFGLVVVTARLLDAYSVECVSPSAALLGYVPLEVSTNGKDFSTSGWTFEIMHRPAVLSVAPSMGPASGGSLLAVEGVHFSHRASSLSYLVCRFNLTEVVASWQSATSILCLAPRSPPGVVLVAVANTPSSFSAERAWFEYSDGMVTSMSPSNGPITGGVLLSLFGHGFSPSYTAGHHCVFGDIASSEATVLSTSLAVCDTPFLTYPVITRVQLRLDGALIDTGFEFSFESPPTVLDIHPRSGPLAGGTQVIVVGHQFTSVPSMYCRFAGIFAMAEYISATRVKCASPPYVLSANATFEVSRGAFGPPFASAVSIYHATSHLPCLLPFL